MRYLVVGNVNFLNHCSRDGNAVGRLICGVGGFGRPYAGKNVFLAGGGVPVD